jgi:hypothetical protein
MHGEARVKRWRQSDDVAARRLDDRVVLVNLKTNHIYSLNPTGSRLWELLRVARSRDEVVQELRREFDVPAAELERDADRLLAELEEASLVSDDG